MGSSRVREREIERIGATTVSIPAFIIMTFTVTINKARYSAQMTISIMTLSIKAVLFFECC